MCVVISEIVKEMFISEKTKYYGKGGSNPRPLACEASVITTKPHPHRLRVFSNNFIIN